MTNQYVRHLPVRYFSVSMTNRIRWSNIPDLYEIITIMVSSMKTLRTYLRLKGGRLVGGKENERNLRSTCIILFFPILSLPPSLSEGHKDRNCGGWISLSFKDKNQYCWAKMGVSCYSPRWDNLPSGHQRYPLFGLNLGYMYWGQKHFYE